MPEISAYAPTHDTSSTTPSRGREMIRNARMTDSMPATSSSHSPVMILRRRMRGDDLEDAGRQRPARDEPGERERADGVIRQRNGPDDDADDALEHHPAPALAGVNTADRRDDREQSVGHRVHTEQRDERDERDTGSHQREQPDDDGGNGAKRERPPVACDLSDSGDRARLGLSAGPFRVQSARCTPMRRTRTISLASSSRMISIARTNPSSSSIAHTSLGLNARWSPDSSSTSSERVLGS